MVCGITPYGNNIVVLLYDEQDSIQEVRLHGVWHRSLWQQRRGTVI